MAIQSEGCCNIMPGSAMDKANFCRWQNNILREDYRKEFVTRFVLSLEHGSKGSEKDKVAGKKVLRGYQFSRKVYKHLGRDSWGDLRFDLILQLLTFL